MLIALADSASCEIRINQIIEGGKLLYVTRTAAEIDGGMGRSKSAVGGTRRGR